MADNTFHAGVSVRRGLLALSPVVLFLLSYVAVSVIIGDFYKMPIAVSLLISSVWAVVIYRDKPLHKRIEIFSRSAGHENVLYMIWVFVLAGAFATLARELGAVEATVRLTLGFFPQTFIVPTLFISACFISLSIGTSVGTVVALTPLAVEIASTAGGDVAFFVAVVLGGAFFGDNLSFISDTTIAATRSQHVGMNEKFKANLRIAVPAAIVTLAIYIFMSSGTPPVNVPAAERPWLILPYLVVIAAAVAGINVTVVLTLGIIAAVVTGLFYGVDVMDMASFAGNGIDSMGGLVIITLLATGMLGIVKAAGGIDFLLRVLTARISGSRGAQGVVALLVAVTDLCTANNTVAIITVGDIARDISKRFGIEPRKTASLLDSASCVAQCLIPYGAQTLLATSLAGISPAAPWRYLFYPWALALMILISIILKRRQRR